MPAPSCFGACRSCSLHAQGHWKRAYAPAWGDVLADKEITGPANIDNRNMSICWKGKVGSGKFTPIYEFEPTHCTLQRFDRKAACELLGKHRSIVFVGDSLTDQFLLSLALHLGGKHSGGKVQHHVSVCNDQVRLVYIRNDLALWMPAPSDARSPAEAKAFHAAHLRSGKSNPFLALGHWVQRAVRDADILVIGTGHHYGMTSWSLDRSRVHLERRRDPNTTHGEPRPDNGILTRAVNHTVSQAIAARARWGHSPASLIMLGAPIPIPACRNYSTPITLAQAFAARLDYTPERDRHFAKLLKAFPVSLLEVWQHLFEANAILQMTAGSLGASFLDVAPIAMTRPDASLARASSSSSNYDCLHSCLPGHVDTWTRLFLALVDDNRAEVLGGSERVSHSRFFSGRFAHQNNFTQPRATESLEACSEAAGCDDVSYAKPCCAASTSVTAADEPWWPFGGEGLVLGFTRTIDNE